MTLGGHIVNKEAFSTNSNANLVGGCRTALAPSFIGTSAADKIADVVGGTVKASDVRVFYPGGIVTDKKLVEYNKGKIIEVKGRNTGN